ncbi:MAG TPA: hypothetical protein VFA66_03270 [Gaiellaceae bacterium]|nr:hypothetical protein [Gaiellaceae bacterium]
MDTLANIPADSRFDEAEADVDHGTAWRYREPDAPNPLTILVTGWSTGVTKLGEAEFLNGIDRDGRKWSVLVGSVVLTKRLIEGTVEEWNGVKNEFVVTRTLGRVQAGEVVSIKYVGDVNGARYAYPNFKVSRKPRTAGSSSGDHSWPVEAAPQFVPAGTAGESAEVAASPDNDIPF